MHFGEYQFKMKMRHISLEWKISKLNPGMLYTFDTLAHRSTTQGIGSYYLTICVVWAKDLDALHDSIRVVKYDII